MNKEQVNPFTVLATARRGITGGRIIPATTRHMGIYETLESIVPFTNSTPSPAEFVTLIDNTRPYDTPMEIEVIPF